MFVRVLRYGPPWSHLDGAADADDQDDAAPGFIEELVVVLVAQYHDVDVVWNGVVAVGEVGLPRPYARLL